MSNRVAVDVDPDTIIINIKKIIDEDPALCTRQDVITDFYKFAIIHEKPEFLEYLINECKLDINTKTPKNLKKDDTYAYNYTALHMACYYKNKVMISKIIELGADLNALDSTGSNALHYIFHFISHIDEFQNIIKYLIENGIDKHKKNKDGKEPIDCCPNHLIPDSIKNIINS